MRRNSVDRAAAAPHYSFTMLAPAKIEVRERAHKENLGQFLTPAEVSDFIASLLTALPAHVRLLDAGAGAGALTAALARRVCQPGSGVRRFDVLAYEIDSHILPVLRQTLAECEARCLANDIVFKAEIRHADFIQEMSSSLSGGLVSAAPPSINVALVNPPYQKIQTISPARLALRAVGIAQQQAAFDEEFHRVIPNRLACIRRITHAVMFRDEFNDRRNAAQGIFRFCPRLSRRQIKQRQ